MRASDLWIGSARAPDVAAWRDIAARAAARFAPEYLPPALAAETTPVASLRRAVAESRLIVASLTGVGVVGFALLERVDEGEIRLEELDVDPEHGRQGIGRALVEAAVDRARERGADRLTLSTFRDVPWNGPFYARCGFVTLPPERWTPGHRALRAAEAARGLDVGRRVIMARPTLRYVAE